MKLSNLFMLFCMACGFEFDICNQETSCCVGFIFGEFIFVCCACISVFFCSCLFSLFPISIFLYRVGGIFFLRSNYVYFRKLYYTFIYLFIHSIYSFNLYILKVYSCDNLSLLVLEAGFLSK